MNPMMDFRQNLKKCHEYVRALEEERRKIEMFRRELPLCLEIITQALESCKQQLSGSVTAPLAAATTTVTATTTTTDCQNGLSECSEQTTSDAGPVFEEFIPLKRGCFSVQGGGEDEEDNEMIELESRKISADFNDCDAKSDAAKKLDWLRSAQLWNQSPDPPTTTADEELQKSSQPRKVSVVEVKNNGGAFHPFQNSMEIATTAAAAVEAAAAPTSTPAPATSASSTAERGGDGIGKKEDSAGKDGGRKSRRCWSPELHRRFLNALEQLGGPHVATPKQIRELMKVDGLTNDEVKSHLQKYRLHARRPAAPAANNNASNQPPQFVVVGGIWVPPTEYASGAATTTTTTTTIANAPSQSVVYAPVAAPPAGSEQQLHQTTPTAAQRHHKQPTRQSAENGVTGRCNAPATSSSARATTAC